MEQQKPQNLPETLTEEEKKTLLGMSEISLWLDTYDDIFSDFDPRPYPQRTLSDDFLYEAKRAVKSRESGVIELKLLVPADKRNDKDEALIKKRLKEHFAHRKEAAGKEIRGTLKQGGSFIFSGVILMLAVSFLHFKNISPSVALSFFITLFEPASWFLFWEGMLLTIFETKRKKPDYDFYRKMEGCRVSFISY